MIKLDENHYVQTAEEVRAIRPMYCNGVADPWRCMALIGGDWLVIGLGAKHLAHFLQQAQSTIEEERSDDDAPAQSSEPA